MRAPRPHWLLVLALLSLRALAAERQSNVVLMEAVGNPVDVEAVRTSLEDWLRSMSLELHLVGVLPPPDATAAFARVRVVWSDENCVVEISRPAARRCTTASRRLLSGPKEAAAVEMAAFARSGPMVACLLRVAAVVPVVPVVKVVPVAVVAARSRFPCTRSLPRSPRAVTRSPRASPRARVR